MFVYDLELDVEVHHTLFSGCGPDISRAVRVGYGCTQRAAKHGRRHASPKKDGYLCTMAMSLFPLGFERVASSLGMAVWSSWFLEEPRAVASSAAVSPLAQAAATRSDAAAAAGHIITVCSLLETACWNRVSPNLLRASEAGMLIG